MGWIEMRNEDERHSRLGRQVRQEFLESLQASRGSADSHDGEWKRRCVGVL